MNHITTFINNNKVLTIVCLVFVLYIIYNQKQVNKLKGLEHATNTCSSADMSAITNLNSLAEEIQKGGKLTIPNDVEITGNLVVTDSLTVDQYLGVYKGAYIGDTGGYSLNTSGQIAAAGNIQGDNVYGSSFSALSNGYGFLSRQDSDDYDTIGSSSTAGQTGTWKNNSLTSETGKLFPNL